MSNQLHGVDAQNYFANVLGFSNSHKIGFDFPKDILTGLPVMFKTQKQGTARIAMSDAKAFVNAMQLDCPDFLIVVATYEQIGDLKKFIEVDQFHMQPNVHSSLLLGDITSEMVSSLTEEIKNYDRFPLENGREASAFVKATRSGIGKLQLEPKISFSGGTQRRIQCSLPFEFMKTHDFNWVNNKGHFRSMPLPMLESEPRKRNNKNYEENNE